MKCCVVESLIRSIADSGLQQRTEGAVKCSLGCPSSNRFHNNRSKVFSLWLAAPRSVPLDDPTQTPHLTSTLSHPAGTPI